MSDDRFDRAIAAIDAANAADPNTIEVAGETRPKELAHAELATAWVGRLDREPSEALLLAARAHHLRRWTSPRTSYPAGRAGYLKWRKQLHNQHAREVAVILTEVGYDDATIQRVQEIVRKRRLGQDPEVQVLEDALCLVFIETQLDDLSQKLEPAKLTDVMVKTAKKMSPQAIEEAMALDIDPSARSLLRTVLPD